MYFNIVESLRSIKSHGGRGFSVSTIIEQTLPFKMIYAISLPSAIFNVKIYSSNFTGHITSPDARDDKLNGHKRHENKMRRRTMKSL